MLSPQAITDFIFLQDAAGLRVCGELERFRRYFGETPPDFF